MYLYIAIHTFCRRVSTVEVYPIVKISALVIMVDNN